MGRWSRPLAEEFVRWLRMPDGMHWLDVGTGTGALAGAICRLAGPASVMACDQSEAFIAFAERRAVECPISFRVAGVGNLPGRTGGYDVVVSSLALNFFPDPARAVREQLHLLRPAGAVGAVVWDYAQGMEFLRYFWDAAASVDPRASELDEGRRFPICHPRRLTELFEDCGAQAVRVEPIVIKTGFADMMDYWNPLLGGTGPAPSFVSGLSREDRATLRDTLHARLPMRADGAFELHAQAWAVVGVKRVAE